MRFLVGMGVFAATLATGVLAQTAAPNASASGAISPPAPVPATPGRGATINLGTGQVVPGSVDTNVVAGQAASATALTSVHAAAARTPTNALPTGTSKITPVQMQNINRLDIELNRLALANRDPADQLRGLIELLQSAPTGNTRPAPPTVARLGSQLAAVTRTLNLTAPQRRQLAIDLNLALNSAELSHAEAQRVLADARAILGGGTATNPEGVEQLMASLTSLVNQLQGNVAHAGSTPPNSPGTAPAGVDATRPPSTTPPAQAGQSAPGQTGQGSGTGAPVPDTPASPPPANTNP